MNLIRTPTINRCIFIGRLLRFTGGALEISPRHLSQEADRIPLCSALFLVGPKNCRRAFHGTCSRNSADKKHDNLILGRGLLKDNEQADTITEEEWRLRLTDQQYYVCRQHGTEMPFSGAFVYNRKAGVYNCLCCGSELFSSMAKFDSGSGWPSFIEAIDEDTLIHRVDESCGMTRIEVLCRKCNSHLGHVFADGPEPTGQRYCINSVALSFRSTS